MNKEHIRTLRIGHAIQKEIAIIIQRRIKNLNFGIITVSSVRVSNDLSHAKIFVTFLNDNTPKQIKTGIRALQAKAMFIRSLLGKIMYLRIIPELVFVYDNSLFQGMKISNLANKIVRNHYLRYNMDIIHMMNN